MISRQSRSSNRSGTVYGPDGLALECSSLDQFERSGFLLKEEEDRTEYCPKNGVKLCCIVRALHCRNRLLDGL